MKGKLHKLIVRPAMLYGLETVPVTKSQEKKLEVAEMRMMRYEVGVTRLDKIRNENITEVLGIKRYSEKIRECRWTDSIRDDMRSVGLREEDALDRKMWKRWIRTGDPAQGTSQ